MTPADQRRYDFADCWSGRFGPALERAAHQFRPLPGWVPTLRTLEIIARKSTKHGSPIGGSRRQYRARRRRDMQRTRAWAKFAEETGNVF